jgi:hypothetical protein
VEKEGGHTTEALALGRKSSQTSGNLLAAQSLIPTPSLSPGALYPAQSQRDAVQ